MEEEANPARLRQRDSKTVFRDNSAETPALTMEVWPVVNHALVPRTSRLSSQSR